uniref:Uncharacterized protein n=1 Tax=Rhizophora mucronata TaxID=61149 RepID=A0A2P2QNA0_RHIMU
MYRSKSYICLQVNIQLSWGRKKKQKSVSEIWIW